MIFNTQEKTNVNLLEKSNGSIDYNNHNNTVSTADEIGSQNCISLEALKGKMSQDLGFDLDIKNKPKNNVSDLNWQEGKVYIKKGKVKVECNYALTPTKSSLRVKCKYCKKIYSSVKGFINHRGRCIHYKLVQNTQYENNSQNYINSSKCSILNNVEKSLQNNQTLNSSVNTQYTENSQYNTKIGSGIQYINDDTTLFNYNFDSRFAVEEREMNDELSVPNLTRKIKGGNVRHAEPDHVDSNPSQLQEQKKSNHKIENISTHDKMDFESFKMHLYAAISCLPKYILTKILRKRKSNSSTAIDEKHEQSITKEELIDMIFSGIWSKVLENNSELKNQANKELVEANNYETNKLQSNHKEKPELNLESIKSENHNNSNYSINDDSFQLNIPVFFRHTLPKDSEWKCYICKVPKNGKENMNMCINCGYIYHMSCQSQVNKITKNDWFCDFCKTHGNRLKPGSKFQIGELVWVNYKGTIWPAQIMDYSKEQFEVIIFHIEKRMEKGSNELLSWSKGIISMDGLASKGVFVRESATSIMHWQSVYKAIKYYMNSLRSKQRRQPQINSKTRKFDNTSGFRANNQKKKKIDTIELNSSNSEIQVFHPLPNEINEGIEQKGNEINKINICPQINTQNSGHEIVDKFLKK